MMINPYRFGRGPGYQQPPKMPHGRAPVEIMLLLGLRKTRRKERRKVGEEERELRKGRRTVIRIGTLMWEQ